jgi:glycine cleavage system H protein
MEIFRYVDIYATKGIEYLIVIGFLAMFVFFCRYLAAGSGEAGGGRHPEIVEWFRVPEGLHFHQGHSWMKDENGSTVRVGIDDFAQKLVGKVDAVDLPEPGTWLAQGEEGWALRAHAAEIPMLSPVDGEVVAVNPAVLRSPELANRDPFGDGWLLKIRPSRLASNRKNLLSGNLARRWVEAALHELRVRSGGGLGALYQDGGLPIQDGGMPVSGIARALDGEHWEAIVRRHFLTEI